MAVSVRRADGPQFIRRTDRPGPEKEVIEEGEQHQVDPDTEREREHGHGSEAGVLQQLAEGEFQIIHGLLNNLKGSRRCTHRIAERLTGIGLHVLTLQRFDD